jgi:GNAT superfamily N-acetyltransferase
MARAPSLAPAAKVDVWRRPGSHALRTELIADGFVRAFSVIHVARALDDVADLHVGDRGAPARLREIALRDFGERLFAGCFERAFAGSPNRYGARDPARAFQRMRARAGAQADELWRVLCDGDVAVGVAMPSVVADDGVPGLTGTLAFVGLFPAARGLGLGRHAHRACLMTMASAGAVRYRDSTDVANRPMLRTFMSNGCRVVGVQSCYRRPPPRAR